MDTKQVDLERTIMTKIIHETNRNFPKSIFISEKEVGTSFLKTLEKSVLFFDKPTRLYKRYATQIKNILVKILIDLLPSELKVDKLEHSFTFRSQKNIFNIGYIIDKTFHCLYCIVFEATQSHIFINEIFVGTDKEKVELTKLDYESSKMIVSDTVRRLNGKMNCIPNFQRTNTILNSASNFNYVKQENFNIPPVLKRQVGSHKISRD